MPANLIFTAPREFPRQRLAPPQSRAVHLPRSRAAESSISEVIRSSLAILIPILLAASLDQRWPSSWNWKAGLAASLLVVSPILWRDSGNDARVSSRMQLRQLLFPCGLLLLLGSLHWQLPVLCLCLAVPAALLETSARRVNVISSTRGSHSTDIQAIRIRLRGMAVDMLRLFGLLLLGISTVWLSQQPTATTGQLWMTVLLIVEYVWWLSIRLDSLLREASTPQST